MQFRVAPLVKLLQPADFRLAFRAALALKGRILQRRHVLGFDVIQVVVRHPGPGGAGGGGGGLRGIGTAGGGPEGGAGEGHAQLHQTVVSGKSALGFFLADTALGEVVAVLHEVVGEDGGQLLLKHGAARAGCDRPVPDLGGDGAGQTVQGELLGGALGPFVLLRKVADGAGQHLADDPAGLLVLAGAFERAFEDFGLLQGERVLEARVGGLGAMSDLLQDEPAHLLHQIGRTAY